MMKKMLWASPHMPTPEQLKELEAEGKIKILKEEDQELFSRLTNTPADKEGLKVLAGSLLDFVADNDIDVVVQPAGSPAFQNVLGNMIAILDMSGKYIPEIWYAHSERVSEDIPQPDGTIKKVSIFRHVCWIRL